MLNYYTKKSKVTLALKKPNLILLIRVKTFIILCVPKFYLLHHASLHTVLYWVLASMLYSLKRINIRYIKFFLV